MFMPKVSQRPLRCHIILGGIPLKRHARDLACERDPFNRYKPERRSNSYFVSFSSVQFSRSFVSNSLRPHESQHARPPCPSPTPGVHSTHVHRVSDAIRPSHPLSSPSPPAPNPSQHQSLFQ